MPRKLRIEIEGGLYHVYSRVAFGLRPFAEEREANVFVRLLRETKARDGFTVYAWCLMPNHVHLAVRTSTVPLSRSMHSLLHRYSLGFNRRKSRRGPLWAGRYQAKLVKDQQYFHRLLAYIHLNPVSAGMVDDPARYPWSGHREIVCDCKDIVVDVDQALLGFGCSRDEARRVYVEALRGARDCDWIGAHPAALDWWKTEDWRESQLVDTGVYVDVLGRSTGLDRPILTAQEYLHSANASLGVENPEVFGRGRREATVRLRALIAVLGVERYGVRVKDLAEAVGRSRGTVSSWVSRGARLRSSSRDFQHALNRLDQALARRS